MNYLRLPTNIPNTVPPNGFVDVFFNPETHALAVKRSDNSIVGLDAVTQAEVLEALGFTPASAAKFVAGAGKLTGPSSNLTIGTAAAKDVGTGAGQVPVTGDYMPAHGAPAVAVAVMYGDASYELLISTGIYQSVTFHADGGIRTLTAKVATPEPTDGQRMYVRVVTGAGGGTLKLGTGISIASLSTTDWAGSGLALAASKSFELLFRYNTTINKWEYISFTGGFA